MLTFGKILISELFYQNFHFKKISTPENLKKIDILCSLCTEILRYYIPLKAYTTKPILPCLTKYFAF